MWAYRLAGPCTFEVCDVPEPSPEQLATGRVILRTEVGGVCGSDLPYFAGAPVATDPDAGAPWPERIGFPMHEIVGTVTASRHPRLAPGDRVVGWAMASDGIAEYVESDGDALWAFDSTDDPGEAIVLQPLACVLYALDQMRDPAGKTVAVLGLGPIGLLFGHVLRARGARVVGVDVIDRSEVAGGYGIDDLVTTHSSRWAASLSAESQPDAVIEAIGHQAGTLDHAVRAVRFAGEIYHFGIPDDPVCAFDLLTFLRKNLTLRSGVTLDRATMLSLADDYLREHPELATTFVTDLLPHHRVQDAFELARRPRPGQIKVAIQVSQS